MIEIRTSNIPNSGYGAFLTFLGARRLNTESTRRSELLLDSHVYYDPLTKTPLDAIMPDGTELSVTLSGENIHGNGNSSYWLPHNLCTDGAILPCGKDVKVTIKQFDFQNYQPLINKENGIGFMGSHQPKDYVYDNNATFSSYNNGCGLVDLGLYGPFKKDGTFLHRCTQFMRQH